MHYSTSSPSPSYNFEPSRYRDNEAGVSMEFTSLWLDSHLMYFLWRDRFFNFLVFWAIGMFHVVMFCNWYIPYHACEWWMDRGSRRVPVMYLFIASIHCRCCWQKGNGQTKAKASKLGKASKYGQSIQVGKRKKKDCSAAAAFVIKGPICKYIWGLRCWHYCTIFFALLAGDDLWSLLPRLMLRFNGMPPSSLLLFPPSRKALHTKRSWSCGQLRRKG